jgi:hypothetical protein
VVYEFRRRHILGPPPGAGEVRSVAEGAITPFVTAARVRAAARFRCHKKSSSSSSLLASFGEAAARLAGVIFHREPSHPAIPYEDLVHATTTGARRTGVDILDARATLHDEFKPALAETDSRFSSSGARRFTGQKYCTVWHGTTSSAGTKRATQHLLKLGRKNTTVPWEAVIPKPPSVIADTPKRCGEKGGGGWRQRALAFDDALIGRVGVRKPNSAEARGGRTSRER